MQTKDCIHANQTQACHRVPPEILRQIFILVSPSQKTLHQCVLTCRQWCRVAIPIMWKSPQFRRLADVERLAATLVAFSPPSTADPLTQRRKQQKQQQQHGVPRFPYAKLIESLSFSTLPEQDRNNSYLATLLDKIVNCLVVVVTTAPPPPPPQSSFHCSTRFPYCSAYAAGHSGTTTTTARKTRKSLLSLGTIKRSCSLLFRNAIDAGLRPYSAADLSLDPGAAVSADGDDDGLYNGSMKPRAIVAADASLPRVLPSLHYPDTVATHSSALPGGLVTPPLSNTEATTTTDAVSELSLSAHAFSDSSDDEQQQFQHRRKQKQVAWAGTMSAGERCHEYCQASLDNSLLISTESMIRPCRECGMRSTDGQPVQTTSSRYVSSLRQLDLRFCKGVRDFSLQRLAPKLSTLTVLNLAGGQRTDITIAKLSQHLHSLRRVSLAWTSNLTDFGVSELVQRCRGIEALDLTYCTQIEDTSMFAIAHNLKELKALSVAYCVSVSDIGVREVATRCAAVRVLNVAKCFRVSERVRVDLEQLKIATICDPFAPFSINEDPHIESHLSLAS
ncbi:hypothetical protein EV177_007041 [Coemansia sp. RSA 1804]|nr:hypothetical protein EV177_007041 [Coemansia sp. RSA 1804]